MLFVFSLKYALSIFFTMVAIRAGGLAWDQWAASALSFSFNSSSNSVATCWFTTRRRWPINYIAFSWTPRRALTAESWSSGEERMIILSWREKIVAICIDDTFVEPMPSPKTKSCAGHFCWFDNMPFSKSYLRYLVTISIFWIQSFFSVADFVKDDVFNNSKIIVDPY